MRDTATCELLGLFEGRTLKRLNIPMTPDFLLTVIAAGIVLWPYLVVPRKYKTVTDAYLGPGASVFPRIDTIWIIVNTAGLLLGWRYLQGYALPILAASTTLPLAIFAGINGAYPERTRGSGYVYYAERKNAMIHLLPANRSYDLHVLGWVQTLLLIAVILFSLSMLFQP